jgi:hypothetical protein
MALNADEGLGLSIAANVLILAGLGKAHFLGIIKRIGQILRTRNGLLRFASLRSFCNRAAFHLLPLGMIGALRLPGVEGIVGVVGTRGSVDVPSPACIGSNLAVDICCPPRRLSERIADWNEVIALLAPIACMKAIAT